VAAMELAGAYVYAGRDVVVDKVLEILGAKAEHEVHNQHNFAWREEHLGRMYWVIWKGCTPAGLVRRASSVARWAMTR
jgi:tRNA-splicing ligase RtcB (3'-phosphate/5'-hydroxy nucleic acid ligase)